MLFSVCMSIFRNIINFHLNINSWDISVYANTLQELTLVKYGNIKVFPSG